MNCLSLGLWWIKTATYLYGGGWDVPGKAYKFVTKCKQKQISANEEIVCGQKKQILLKISYMG